MGRIRSGAVIRYRGHWYARVQYLDDAGDKRDIRRRADSKTHAHDLVLQILGEIRTGGDRLIDGATLTFRQLADEYERTHLTEAQYVGERKVAGLRSLATPKAFLDIQREYFGRRRVRSITHGDLEQYKLDRLAVPTKRKTPRSIASVNRELELLRAVFHYADREGWLQVNPFGRGRALISKADEVKRDRILTLDEESRLLEACLGPRTKHLVPIVICAVDTGMRQGEIFNLCWLDVLEKERLIRIRAKNTKTLTARSVGITERLRRELEKLKLKAGPDYHAKLVFGVAKDIKKAWATVLHRANITNLRFHDLRHTAITRMIQSGIPPAVVMKLSGHTQMTTFARYVNPNADIAASAAAVLGNWIQIEGERKPKSSS